jgi:hypothetical protein
MHRRIIALAAALALAVLGVTAWMAGGADATTGTCLGTQNPVSGPVSCGGLFLPGMGPAPSTTVSTASLTLTAQADYWNAPITFAPYSSGNQHQDFTVYERCNSVGALSTRTESNPCSGTPIATCQSAPLTAGCPVFNFASGQPEFATEVTPLGHHLGTTTVNAATNQLSFQLANLCVSFEGQRVGPHGKIRHVLVERTCDTFGATFYQGVTDGTSPNPPFSQTGVTGVVTSPNPYQTDAAIPTSAGLGGVIIANEVLSGNFHNTLWVLDDQGLGYPAGRAIFYPENDQKNQVAEFLGCNGAVIATGLSNDCP